MIIFFDCLTLMRYFIFTHFTDSIVSETGIILIDLTYKILRAKSLFFGIEYINMYIILTQI